jgi:hypothetical protein
MAERHAAVKGAPPRRGDSEPLTDLLHFAAQSSRNLLIPHKATPSRTKS